MMDDAPAEAAPMPDWMADLCHKARTRVAQKRAARTDSVRAASRILTVRMFRCEVTTGVLFLPVGSIGENGNLAKKWINAGHQCKAEIFDAAGVLRKTFRIVSLKRETGPWVKSDPSRVPVIAAEIRRICGDGPAVTEFLAGAADVLSTGKDVEPCPARVSPGMWEPASGRDCRRGAHTASRLHNVGAELCYSRPRP